MITAINNFNLLPPTDGMLATAALKGDGFSSFMQNVVCPGQQKQTMSTEQNAEGQKNLENTEKTVMAAQPEDNKENTDGDIKQTLSIATNLLLQYNNTDILDLAASVNDEATTGVIGSTDNVAAVNQTDCSYAVAATQFVPGQAVADNASEIGLTYQLPSAFDDDQTVITALNADSSAKSVTNQKISGPEAVIGNVEEPLAVSANLPQQNVKIVTDGLDANDVYSQMKLQKSVYDITQENQTSISDSISLSEQKPAANQVRASAALADASSMSAMKQPEVIDASHPQTSTNSSLADSDQQQTDGAVDSGSSNKDKVTDTVANEIDFSKHLADSVLTVADTSVKQVSDTSVPVSDTDPAFAQITDKITETIKDDGNKSFEISLYPEGLGKVQVTLKCQDSRLAVEITTDNPLTQKLLESQAQDLRAALVTKNYEVQVVNINAKESTYLSADNAYAFFESKPDGGLSGQNRNYVVYGYEDVADSVDQSFTLSESFYNGQLSIWA